MSTSKKIIFHSVGNSYWVGEANKDCRLSIQRNQAANVDNVRYSIYKNGIFVKGEFQKPSLVRKFIDEFIEKELKATALISQGESI